MFESLKFYYISGEYIDWIGYLLTWQRSQVKSRAVITLYIKTDYNEQSIIIFMVYACFVYSSELTNSFISL